MYYSLLKLVCNSRATNDVDAKQSSSTKRVASIGLRALVLYIIARNSRNNNMILHRNTFRAVDGPLLDSPQLSDFLQNCIIATTLQLRASTVKSRQGEMMPSQNRKRITSLMYCHDR